MKDSELERTNDYKCEFLNGYFEIAMIYLNIHVLKDLVVLMCSFEIKLSS